MLIRDIAQALSARFEGDGGIEIKRLVSPSAAEKPSDLALAMSAEAAEALAASKAQAVVISAKRQLAMNGFKAVIAVEDARLALAKLTALFDTGASGQAGIHPTAIVAPDAVIGGGVAIGPYTVVGPRSRIGAGTRLLSHITIGADVTIGEKSLVHAGTRIGDRVTIGARAIIHANAVIGADGFSFAPDMTSPTGFTAGVVITRIHSLGDVVIGDDVEIGAGSTIDRATLASTRIGRGTKIDNLVHIGHNVTIGENCILCGMVGIAGSAVIGDRVRIAGGVGIGDHVVIGDEAVVAAGSGVAGKVPPRTFVSGYPALPHERTLENLLYINRAKRLHGKVDDIDARLRALEGQMKK